ncbi:micos complex subunit mic60 [Citrus sinensis]|uniref:Micos complex subunit mic60 n=2 Tax=Citrus sinensis TaxID=2711 RepID=A0ACB8JLB8_CITSI|nr:micos complex subunit mic60 [Citrus sinensis]
MLRRSILELSSRRRVPRQIIAQLPSIISARKEYSTASQKNVSPKPGPTGKPPKSESNFSPIIFGATVVVGVGLIAYRNGYLDQYIDKEKEKHSSLDSSKFSKDKNDVKDDDHVAEPVVFSHSDEEPKTSISAVEQAMQSVEPDKDIRQPEALSKTPVEDQPHLQDKAELTPQDQTMAVKEKDAAENSNKSIESREPSTSPPVSSEGSIEVESSESKSSKEKDENVQGTGILSQTSAASEKDEQKAFPQQSIIIEDKSENELSNSAESPASLLDAYHLRDKIDEGIDKATEDFINVMEELNNGYLSKDGKVVLDFLQAIHAAEQRQAELDGRAFAEEKRALKEKYEKELRDSRARELMRTEEAAILEKELKRERAKAAATIKSLQEKMEEKLRMELEQKENEAESKLKNALELAKAELAASIAREKVAQIEKMAEANLHINALCMAFYARSEEARKSYFAHKLALGALALEDALSRGLPIQKEIDTLYTYLDGIEKDSVLDLVLSSLPEETRYHGTETLLQLNQKFDALKGTLRHFSLIPPGGGGILTHSLAHIASWLKVKEADQANDGIESVICRVESYLREGKLAEAADALEEGVRGSQAEEIVFDWVRRARNRAITEQGLTFLQSYATCLSIA